jgi:hypothetical protein
MLMRLVGTGPSAGPLVELLFGPPHPCTSAIIAIIPATRRERLFVCMPRLPASIRTGRDLHPGIRAKQPARGG